MENKNILMLRHHPMNVKYTNPFYTGQTEDDLGDYLIIDVTSRAERDREFMAAHPSFVKDLSPFFIGPVTGPDGAVAQIFEIFWQCGKVYPCHDAGGRPNPEFFDWRKEYYGKTACTKDLMRHACQSLGYENRDCRYFAYYDTKTGVYVPLSWVEARKKVYVPEYAKLVFGTESFKWLKYLADEGRKIALVDFDGYNYNEECGLAGKYTEHINRCKKYKTAPTLSERDFTSVDSIKKVLDCPFMAAGHGFVIKALLQGDIEVEDGEVIDREGILA